MFFWFTALKFSLLFLLLLYEGASPYSFSYPSFQMLTRIIVTHAQTFDGHVLAEWHSQMGFYYRAFLQINFHLIFALLSIGTLKWNTNIAVMWKHFISEFGVVTAHSNKWRVLRRDKFPSQWNVLEWNFFIPTQNVSFECAVAISNSLIEAMKLGVVIHLKYHSKACCSTNYQEKQSPFTRVVPHDLSFIRVVYIVLKNLQKKSEKKCKTCNSFFVKTRGLDCKVVLLRRLEVRPIATGKFRDSIVLNAPLDAFTACFQHKLFWSSPSTFKYQGGFELSINWGAFPYCAPCLRQW